MGAIKSITHSYTWNEYLFWYIQRKDIPQIQWVLENKPTIINDSLTVNYKTTPLHRAAVNGSLEICKLLIEKYQADVNHPTENGQTPLMGAAKRDHIQIVRYLLSMGADPQKVSPCGLIAVQYSLLSGFYETSLVIFERMKKKELKNPLDYQQMGIVYNYRYVNYSIFVQNLLMQIDPDNVPNFLTKPKRVFADPVVDPRETWKQWIVRQIDFKDPPLCQRSELSQDLQPQNRLFGKIRHYMSKMAMTHKTQKPSLYPVSMSEVDSRETFHHKQDLRQQKAEQSQLQMKTVS